ncbi:MAG: TRAP C4-dicarboxylate transport system [Beijerinckiaceae bacterium]|nr:MAG: TRAP C4-dicarboxylate transport system [Beijerinckiaceae bacterium]
MLAHVFANLSVVGISAILLGCLILILASGVWIAVALGIVGFIGMLLAANVPIGQVLATTTWSATASWTLAALPLFIWMGEILFRTKLSEEMFKGLAPWVQWLPGRLVHANVIGCGIFAAVSGSSAATCATVGKMTLPELEQRGYDKDLSLGSLAGSGTLGLLIPPSIPMVVYAVSANVSVLQVFLAGFIPGAMVMSLFMGYIVVWSLLNPGKTPPRDPRLSLGAKLRQSKKLIPILLLIAGVFFSLVLGFATATECAAFGVVGALLLAYASGSLTWPTFLESLMSAARLSCMIMFILAGAAFTTAAMGYTGIPVALAKWVNAQGLSPYMLIFAMTIMYIILGCLIDGISMIVLTVVIVLPMVQQAGFDLVWFGVYLIILIEMAQITPPVGFNLFVLQNMSGRDTVSVAKAALPFFILLNVAVVIITVFPNIVLYLPKLVFPD